MKIPLKLCLYRQQPVKLSLTVKKSPILTVKKMHLLDIIKKLINSPFFSVRKKNEFYLTPYKGFGSWINNHYSANDTFHQFIFNSYSNWFLTFFAAVTYFVYPIFLVIFLSTTSKLQYNFCNKTFVPHHYTTKNFFYFFLRFIQLPSHHYTNNIVSKNWKNF